MPAGAGIFGGIYGDQFYRVQSLSFDEQGSVHIQRQEKLPQGIYYIQLPGNFGTLQLLLPADQEFELTTHVDDLAGSIVISGSEDNIQFYKHLAYQQNYQKAFRQLSNRIKEAGNDPDLKEKTD